jgi:hypothetical protein
MSSIIPSLKLNPIADVIEGADLVEGGWLSSFKPANGISSEGGMLKG